jgi:nitrite reductase/ring-hydroxylating ferredoxin subunit
MNKRVICEFDELEDRKPAHALVAGVDLVVTRFDDRVSVLYGRCAHRGALMSDGHVDGDNLICGLHGWDYRIDTGVSEYNNSETLPKFKSWVEEGKVLVDEDEIAAWASDHPQPYKRDAYQGAYQDPTGTADEPHVKFIRKLAGDGLDKFGRHGPTAAMGVPRDKLPKWDDLQFVVGQLHKLPLLDDEEVGTELVIGPNAAKPLRLDIPLFVSDMSFGALSEEAKVALARGAELAGTGICSGEGGMLPDEQEANSRYFYELASAAGRGPRPGPADTCPATRCRARSPRCGSWRRASPPCRRPAFPTGRNSPSSGNSPGRYARKPAASRWVSSCRHSTSKETSTRRWRSVWITSSSTAAAAAPARRR